MRLPSVRSTLKTADWKNIFASAEDDLPVQLIRAFIRHVVAKLSQSKVVKTIVILADEVAEAEEQIAADVTSILRKAVLDESILPELQATVVISSLTLSPLGAMPSGRHPVILELPERLDAEKVVKSWWAREGATFEFAAAALSDLPRLLEFGAGFLDEFPDSVARNPSNVSELFVHVREQLQGRYFPRLPSFAELYPAVFGEETERNETAMAYILESIFVNALKDVRMPRCTSRVTPVVSLFMISAAAKASRNPSSFAKLVAEFPENIELKEEGRPLECCAMWWLRMRLATAAGKKDFPLEKLLGLEGVDFEDAEDRCMLKLVKKVIFHVPSDDFNLRRSYRKGKLASSRKQNAATFLEQLNQLGKEADEVWLLCAADREGWDILLSVYDTQDSKWFLAFIDLKARQSSEDADQARYVQSLASRAQSRGSVAPSSLLEALKDKRYCFLYITTAEGASSANELAITMRRDDTERFFGPLSAIHSAIRKAFTSS
ncbi:unnamed protein product [Symbiodinium necroappetens]|uniref:Uncharacterized protein n=1 Tax=Symbiodinium necroappetens TaxID=1628268 RepID=A0A812S4A3_9DINO|nr:unnamed protein product [Symbiodinium necroappetens]